MQNMIQLVKQMRDAQKKVFIKASDENVKRAQMLEKSVDKLILEYSKK